MTQYSEKYNFIVSSRNMEKDRLRHSLELWDEFILTYFRKGKVKEVFGSTPEPCPLNGGRPYQVNKVFSYDQIARLNSFGIGYMLTLTNHNYSSDAYRIAIPILEQLENGLNSVVITNDQLARRIKEDFPGISIKASVIKLLATHDEISRALELYDSVCLVPWLNDNEKLLSGIQEKKRIVLFANTTCLYRCRKPICYQQISNNNFDQQKDIMPKCNLKLNDKDSPMFGKKIETHVFDISEARFDGFGNFKLVPIDFAKMLGNEYITKKYY